MSTVHDLPLSAREAAEDHFGIDPGLKEIHYLPKGGNANEIRFVFVNPSVWYQSDDHLIPVHYPTGPKGVDPPWPTLAVIDATERQWKKLADGRILLPDGWSLDGLQTFTRP